VVLFESEGVYGIGPLDSQRIGNPWHRVGLEMTVPDRTSVQLLSLTSDVLQPDIKAKDLLPESASTLAGWQSAPLNAPEWLIQSPPGRYLYLALVLKGVGTLTPAIQHLYVYAHRQSSLRYLPPVYQADETSRSVLDRLLSLTDTLFGEIESEIEEFARFLDAQGAPADFLPWLSSWFDLALEQSWSEAQRRAFVQNIVSLYHQRGTLRGLRRLLQLHTNVPEPMPQIVEHYRGFGVPALEAWFGEAPEGDAAHHFSVLLPAYTIDTPEKRAIVARLIDANKPAHTHYTLRPLSPGIRLTNFSDSTTLGMESRLGFWKLPTNMPQGNRLGVGSGLNTWSLPPGYPTRNQPCGAALGLNSVLGSYPDRWQLPGATDPGGILGGQTVLPAAAMPKAVSVRLGATRLGVRQRGRRICPPCNE
jgi:phage tail-like protein